MHINYSTGKINIDFHKDGAVWNNPSIGSASYVINKASGKKYTMSQNPNYLYAYQTATNLPYGTYDVYIKGGVGAAVQKYSTIELNAANVFLRPKYFTFAYNGNGADAGGSVPVPAVWLSGKKLTVDSGASLAKAGYVFNGWKTAASSGTAYAAGSTLTLTAKTTLYAQWKQAIGRINFDFYKNGAVWNNPSVGSAAYVVNKDTGTKYTLTQNPDYPYAYRTAATLPYGTYYAYVKSGTGSSDGTVFLSSVTLNAANAWTSPKYYTVTYNKNGATGGSAPAAVTRLANQSITVAGQGTMVRSGYVFTGWKTAASSGTAYAAGASLKVDGAKTLYAQWQAVAQASARVYLNGNYWTSCRYSMELRNVDTGAVYPLYYESESVYTTDGTIPCGNYDVYVASDGNDELVKTGDTFALSHTNNTAMVRYYTIAFNGNGYTSGTKPASRTCALGASMPVPNEGSMVNTGKTFCYWTISDYPNTPIVAGSTYTITGEETLFAKWIEGNYALGDVDANGKINTTDASLVQQYVAARVELDADAVIRADFDDDGEVDTTDARMILQAAAGRELLAAGSTSSTLGNVSMGQIGAETMDWNAVLPNGGTITWDDLDWSLLDMDAIDWDTFTMEELFRILLGNQTGDEVM